MSFSGLYPRVGEVRPGRLPGSEASEAQSSRLGRIRMGDPVDPKEEVRAVAPRARLSKAKSFFPP